MKYSADEEKISIKKSMALSATILIVTLGLFLLTINSNTVSATTGGGTERDSGAGFSKTIVEGDIETGIILDVSESRDEVSLVFSQLNINTFESITSIFETVSIDEDDFSMTPDLDSASLDTTITVFDEVSQGEKRIALEVSWTGVGKLGNFVDQFHTPRFFHPPPEFGGAVHYTITGLCRGATASVNLSGDITLDTDVTLPQSEDDTQTAFMCKSFSITREMEIPN
jgi:hypothetical protein